MYSVLYGITLPSSWCEILESMRKSGFSHFPNFYSFLVLSKLCQEDSLKQRAWLAFQKKSFSSAVCSVVVCYLVMMTFWLGFSSPVKTKVKVKTVYPNPFSFISKAVSRIVWKIKRDWRILGRKRKKLLHIFFFARKIGHGTL